MSQTHGMRSQKFGVENVLFPMALVVEEAEWPDTRRQFDELGYRCFTPEPARAAYLTIS